MKVGILKPLSGGSAWKLRDHNETAKAAKEQETAAGHRTDITHQRVLLALISKPLQKTVESRRWNVEAARVSGNLKQQYSHNE